MSNLHLELVVSSTMEEIYQSIPLEEAKPLITSRKINHSNTYLAEIIPGNYFGFRIVQARPDPSAKKSIGCHITIDNIPISSHGWWYVRFNEASADLTAFERSDVTYPFQFSKSQILQDLSEAKNRSRNNLSHVGKIVFKFQKAVFAGTSHSTQKNTRVSKTTPIVFEETIKITESQSKDKGVCVVGATPIDTTPGTEFNYFTPIGGIFKEIVIVYRDPIGMIHEKQKRNMLQAPPIRHSDTVIDVTEEELPIKKVKREAIDVSHSSIIDLEEKVQMSNTTIKSEIINEVVLSWSVSQVIEWLQSLSVYHSEIAKRFEEEEICGEVLLTLKEEDLKSLGCTTMGKRRLLLHAIEKLRHS